MRGLDTQQAGLLSDPSPEKWVPSDAPLAANSAVRGYRADRLVPQAGEALCPNGSALDCHREATAGPVTAGAIPSAQ